MKTGRCEAAIRRRVQCWLPEHHPGPHDGTIREFWDDDQHDELVRAALATYESLQVRVNRPGWLTEDMNRLRAALIAVGVSVVP